MLRGSEGTSLSGIDFFLKGVWGHLVENSLWRQCSVLRRQVAHGNHAGEVFSSPFCQHWVGCSPLDSTNPLA